MKKNSPKDHSVTEMVLVASGTKPDLNARSQLALEEKGISPEVTKNKYVNKMWKYFLQCIWIFSIVPLGGDEISHHRDIYTVMHHRNTQMITYQCTNKQ